MTELFITDIGSKWWWYNGQFHRVNGPAIVWYDGYQSHYYNIPKVPASSQIVKRGNRICEFWLNDRRVSEYEHMMLTGAIRD